MRSIGIDISWYQDHLIPFEKLACVDWVTCKCDTRTSVHVPAAKAAGKRVGLYYWQDPLQLPSTQAAKFQVYIDTFKPAWISIDVEQWWADWEKWDEARRWIIPWSEVPVLPANQINDTASELVAIMASRFPRVEVYTGKWFIDGYCPAIGYWIGDHNPWLAQYITLTDNHVTYSSLQTLADGLSAPVLPIGCYTWHKRQFSSKILMPDYPYSLDTNFFNGDLAALDRWIGGGETVELSARVKVNADTLTIRSAPVVSDTTVLGYTYRGKVWEIMGRVKAADGREWVQVGPGAFMAGWLTLPV